MMNTPNEVKARASKLRELLVGLGHQLKHTESLEVISKLEGYADWNTYTAYLTKTQKVVDRDPGTERTEVNSSTPDHSQKSVDNRLLYCSFCGKSQHEVRKLIAGPSVFICDECTDICVDIVAEEMREAQRENNGPESSN